LGENQHDAVLQNVRNHIPSNTA